jgi:hypothetical protein
MIDVCVNQDTLNLISVFLQQPDGTDDFGGFEAGTDNSLTGQLAIGRLLSWQDATGQSLDSFYEDFLDSTNQCFSSPKGVW